MALMSWTFLLGFVAVGGWLLSAFWLRFEQIGRFAVTAFLPVLAAIASMLIFYVPWTAGPDPDETAGWRLVFIALSIIVGSMAALPAAVIWLVMENRLGGRAR